VPHLEYTDEELQLPPDWDFDQESGSRLSPAIRTQLRKAKVLEHEAREREAELNLFRRKEAFQRAGIPNDDRGDLFAKGHPDLTDPVEIKTKYESLFGPLSGSADGQTGTNSDPGNDPAARVVDAGATGSGTGSGGNVDVDINVEMTRVWEEAAAKGGPQAGNQALKAFIDQNQGNFPETVIDGRPVKGIKLPDIY
jgi:hypothetical protein